MSLLTNEERAEYQKHKDSLEHPGDMRYTDVDAPEGVCKNRYCPEDRELQEALVRGYCAPCASIRKPIKTKSANTFVPWQEGRRRTWSNMDQDWTGLEEC